MLSDEQTTHEQFEAYRRMTPERRLALAENLYWSARELKKSWLRNLHADYADWTDQEISDEVTRLFNNARS